MMQLRGLLITLMVAKSTFLVREASGEEVCFSREEKDDRNIVVRKVPCDEQGHVVYKKFASRGYVNIADLLGEINPRCAFDELPKISNGRFKIKMTWNEAEEYCRSMSSHLVYINDAEENTLVKNMLNKNGLSSYASIGLIQGSHGNEWLWLDGSEASYINWDPIQVQDFEGCVGINGDGLWHDHPCGNMVNFICEK
ncbi:Collectin-12 [Holothuria leucospilota]|uniref:Collectin-12 n=1 Tax=Holothuria leucospilota TaxID=206669 RepID=A0A9Q0YG66_HOLLE|nr:Collectin-12 [Holothuria leucospilota]